MINIIIPIGGLGLRFKNEGYTQPKPLVNVLGKPIIYWLLDNLNVMDSDKVYIPYHPSLSDFYFESKIKNRYKNINFVFIKIETMTKGACETIKLVLNDESFDETLPTISIDCDTFHTEDILTKFRMYSDNCIFYTINEEEKPIFSYIKMGENGLITDIKEKIKISDFANIGSYGFKNGVILKKYIDVVLTQYTEGESYISKMYEHMIENGVKVHGIKIDGYHCLGTPNQVKIFVDNNINSTNILRFCFDLDNTLVTNPIISGDYSTVNPIDKNIKFLKKLKKLGHHIIIYTARRMRTHDGNVNNVIKDVGDITFKTLEKFDIPYDELIFGKPYAHYYIDDLAINVFSDLEKETGFYDLSIPTRDFNELSVRDDVIIKKTNNKCESYWYLNSPDKIKKLIPNFQILDESTISLEKIKGIPLSHLLIKKNIDKNIIDNLLTTIDSLHNSKVSILNKKGLNFYIKKLDERMTSKSFDDFKDISTHLTKIKKYIKEYVLNHDGNFNVIHGDPVFSNILLNENNGFNLIDMRGSFGYECDLYGDKNYDYAKIYQSIIGYDNIMLNESIDNEYSLYLENIFFGGLVDRGINLNYVKLLTSYLFLTLIPLHSDITKITMYYNLSKMLLNDYEKNSVMFIRTT